MVRRLLLIIVVLCFSMLNIQETTAAQDHVVVKGILFWTPDCSSCLQVLNNFIPSVLKDYGNKIEIRFIKLVSTQEIDQFYAVVEQAGWSIDKAGLPFLIMGEHVLVGSEEIQNSMKTVIESSRDLSGSEYPTWFDFTQFVWTSDFSDVQAVLSQTVDVKNNTQSSGMTLAWVTMVGLLLVLAVIIVNVIRGYLGISSFYTVKYYFVLIPVLAMFGLAVAVYLSYVEITAVPALCGPVGDCNSVQQSSYARIFGILPVGLAGVGGYLAILAAWIWKKMGKDDAGNYVPVVLFGMTLFGTLFSIYLTYLEIFVIHAVCIWCITSAIIMGLLALICTPEAVTWIAGMEDES